MKKVLVVNEEEQNSVDLCIKLKNKGYDVFCARDTRDSVKISDIFKPDILVIESSMPETDGLGIVDIVVQPSVTNSVFIFTTGITPTDNKSTHFCKKTARHNYTAFSSPVSVNRIVDEIGIRD